MKKKLSAKNIPKWFSMMAKEMNLDLNTVKIEIENHLYQRPELFVDGKYSPAEIEDTGKRTVIIKGEINKK